MTPITVNVVISYGCVVLTFFAGLKYVNRLLHNVFDEGKMVIKTSEAPSVSDDLPKGLVENGKNVLKFRSMP